MKNVVIDLKNITKKYNLKLGKQSLIGNLLSWFRKKSLNQTILALDDINFSVQQGETVGIIGENGSGKTTILRIISKITTPSQGYVKTEGKIAGILELGAGIHPELTGRENIYLDAALFGMSKSEIDKAYKDIVEFSELGNFIDAQVKTYSQGMLLRLGFSVAVHVNPDIFLIDDSMGVGDEEFQRKCLKKISELKKLGKTIIIVSHDLSTLSSVCQRGILIKNGKIVRDDLIHKTIVRYIESIGAKNCVASLDQDRLSIIFNQGKLIVLWEGIPLTKNFGGYVALEILGQWLMSWQANWQVSQTDADYFEVIGNWDKYAIELTIKIKLISESHFKWSCNIKIPKVVKAQKAAVSLMVTGEYNYYFKDGQKIRISGKSKINNQWKDLYRTDEKNAQLALISENSGNDLPVVLSCFSSQNNKGYSLIQSTDSDLDSRVVQMHFKLSEHLIAAECDKYVVDCDADIELINRKEFKQTQELQQDMRTLKNKNLKLELKEDKFHIFYKKYELTQNDALSFGFFFGEYYFNLFKGQWQLKKITPHLLNLSADFKELGVGLKLKISLTPDQIEWELTAEKTIKKDLNSLNMNLFLNSKYETFLGADKEDKFILATEFNEQIKSVDTRLGILGVRSQDNNYPDLIIEDKSKAQLYLENASFDINARILKQKILSQDKLSGKILLFVTAQQRENFLEQKKNQENLTNRITFENLQVKADDKKITIINNGKEITPGDGLNSAIFLNQRWYESTPIIKEVKKNNNQFKILIKRQIPAIDEIWRISLNKGQISWQADLIAHEVLPEFQYKAGFWVPDIFNQWSDEFNTNNFNDILKTHQAVFNNNSINKLLIITAENNELPCFLFEILGRVQPLAKVMQNREDENNLQFAFKIKAELEKVCTVFEANIKLESKENFLNYLKKYRDTQFGILISENQKFLVSPQKIGLVYANVELLVNNGLCLFLDTNLGRIETKNAAWVIQRMTDKRIQVTLKWQDLPLSVKWFFTLKENKIQWDIIFVLTGQLQIEDLTVDLQLTDFYNYLFTEHQNNKINFLSDKPELVDLEKTETIIDNRSSFIGVKKNDSDKNSPVLIFKPRVDMHDWFFHLHKKSKDDFRCLGVHKLMGQNKLILKEGNHSIFSGLIMMSDVEIEDLNIINYNQKEEQIKIFKKNIRIEFDLAKARIYWKNIELTKNLSLYTAFYHQDKWIDSTIAKWHILTHPADNRIQILLFWNKLNIHQKWHFEISDQNVINWKIFNEINEPHIHNFSAALMVKDCYQKWQEEQGSREGHFVAEFNPDHWQEIVATDKYIGVKKQDPLPHIAVSGFSENIKCQNVIENTDGIHQSRVLKCNFLGFKQGLTKNNEALMNIIISDN
ncbi:MAG: ABC transporter ATP-binding protein [Candidatus Omnitrophota bacterium]